MTNCSLYQPYGSPCIKYQRNSFHIQVALEWPEFRCPNIAKVASYRAWIVDNYKKKEENFRIKWPRNAIGSYNTSDMRSDPMKVNPQNMSYE